MRPLQQERRQRMLLIQRWSGRLPGSPVVMGIHGSAGLDTVSVLSLPIDTSERIDDGDDPSGFIVDSTPLDTPGAAIG